MTKRESASEKFLKLSPAERKKLTAEFDKEFVADTFKPLSKEKKLQWQKARKRGRPKVGSGAQVISVSIERSLLERSDELAKELQVSRANLIARGLKAILAANGQL